MQKNQEYNKSEMFQSIEKWQTSRLSQFHIIKREKSSTSTFSYWLRKYRKEKGLSNPSREKPVKTFIPVEVSKTIEPDVLEVGQIEIIYPNSVKISCPASIDIDQLKTLISI